MGRRTVSPMHPSSHTASSNIEIPSDWTTATLADACMRIGLPVRCAPLGIASCWPSTIAGRARPVRHFGSVDVFLEAIDLAQPGEVLAIDNGGREDESCVGDLTALEARAAGLAGIVCWGAIRDSTQLPAIGLPVFAYGTLSRGPDGVRPRSPDALTSARFGPDLVVTAADIVFADADGVLFVDAVHLERVLAAERAIRTMEREQARKAGEGISLREQFRFREYLERRQTSPDHTFREHLRHHGLAIEV